MPHYHITVRPFDWDAPGSYQLRKRWIRAMDRLRRATEAGDQTDSALAIIDIEEMMEGQLDIAGGAPLADVLEEISAADFDALIAALSEEVSADPVPLESARRSNAGMKRAPRSRRG